MGSSHERLDFHRDSSASRDAMNDVMFADKIIILIILAKKFQFFCPYQDQSCLLI